MIRLVFVLSLIYRLNMKRYLLIISVFYCSIIEFYLSE
ncbi:hypothetical protein EVA_13579 [gut metagenome]|uniref:Uncharacterized protein n=1 Tax=gut metagenome TaxID=749906 RepID=J9FUY1_9ZZZZ